MSELTYEQLERLISEINSGQKLVYVSDLSDRERPLLFRHPTPKDKELSRHIYNRALKEAEEMELPSLEDMERLVKERNLFSVKDRKKLEKLQAQLNGQNALLVKTTKVPARRDRIKKNIDRLEKEISDLRSKRERHFDFTRERKAMEEKLLYLTWCGTLDPFKESLYWPEYSDFLDEKDAYFRKKTFLEYALFFHGVDQTTMRYIARSNLWRVRYVTALKTSDSLFNRAISDYTSDQIMLMYWSNYYQSIYEMLPDDRPPETIIEDDQALDAYMKDWQADRNREQSASRSKKNNKYGNPSAWDFNETLVMRSNDMYEDIEYSDTFNELGLHKDAKAHNAAPARRNEKKR